MTQGAAARSSEKQGVIRGRQPDHPLNTPQDEAVCHQGEPYRRSRFAPSADRIAGT